VAGGSFNPHDTNNAALNANITGREQPSGGATIADWLTVGYYNVEEGVSSTGYDQQRVNLLDPYTIGQQWVLREGEGFLVKQGGETLGVGLFHLVLVFTVE